MHPTEKKAASGVAERMINIRSPRRNEVACAQCEFHGFLQLFNEIPLELAQIFLFRQRPVPKGETVFREGQPFHGVYAIKEGGVKAYLNTPQQTERILSFILPGELLGLEAIRTTHYQSTAVALENTQVCWLPLNQLDLLGDRFPHFQEQLINVLAIHLAKQQHHFILSARQSADERLAAFLLNLSERYTRHGLGGELFRLAMLRQDIANFLGISMETVSRTFKRFQTKKLLNVTGKHVRLLDIPAMQEIAQYVMPTHQSAP
ncbi:MAG: helix-turn-helix domain-containing protein [Magnetococcales bacterium]|nr:helix-turn-helix domain-containing protein [Magnetococcales bacterium]